MLADVAHGHQRTSDVRYLEDSHERVLLAARLRLEVEVHLAFVRDAMAVAHHEVLLSLAAGVLEDAVSWRFGCVHHVVCAPRIQRDLNFNILPLAQERFIALVVVGDDQGVFLSAAEPLKVLLDLGHDLRTESQT